MLHACAPAGLLSRDPECYNPGCSAGAGKTFTLSSLAPDNIGMMPRSAAAVFNGIKADPAHHYTVHMSYMQIYMEMIQVPAAASIQFSDILIGT